jgi:PAS domain S-box-containing protein
VLDSTGRIDWMSAAAERVSGYELGELKGSLAWEVLIPRDESAAVQEVFRSLAEGQPPTTFENDWQARDGKRHRFLWSNSFVTDDIGQVQWIIGTGTDISAVRYAERELHRSQLRAQAVLDAALGGILAVDPAGVIQFANPELERMFGYARGELIGQPLQQLLPERFRDVHQQHHERYYAQPESRPMGSGLDLQGLRKNGEEFPVEISLGYAGRDADNLVVAFVVDLTVVTRTQQELAKSLAEVRDLTGRLLTAQENERRLIARNLHDGLVQELVAHKVGLSVLARKPETENAGLTEDALALEREAQRLAEHARKLSHEIHPAVLEHLGLMSALRSNGAEVGRTTGVNVLIETEGKLPALSRKASLGLYRIVQEAVWNAARHSGAAVVKVTVRADQQSCELTVADDGSGFDLSETSHSDSLGLISMRERARLIHATLNVDSTPGLGTTVRVALKPEAAE